MSKQERKREVDLECHVFRAQWSVDYLVIDLDGKTVLNKKAVLKESISITSLSSFHNIPNS